MQWLLNLAEEYRKSLRSGPFYKALAKTSKPEDIRGWIRQLYYQSRDSTSALSLRYAVTKANPLALTGQVCFLRHQTLKSSRGK